MPQHGPAILTRREVNGEVMDPVYLAGVEAVEEAVVNALVAGEDVATVKPAGRVVRAIDTDRLRRLFAG